MSGPLAVETHYGRKTVTRRLINLPSHSWKSFDSTVDEKGRKCWIFGPNLSGARLVRPKYQRGDWCYIREPFSARAYANGVAPVGQTNLDLDHAFWQDIPRPLRKPPAIEWVCYRGDMSYWYINNHEDEETKKQYPLLHLIAANNRNHEISEFAKHRWYAGRFMPKWMGRTLVRIVDVQPQRLQEIDDADAAMEGFPLPYSIEPGSPRGEFFKYWNDLHANDSNEISVADNPWVWRYEWQLAQVEPFAHWPETNEGAHYHHESFNSMRLEDF